MSTLHESRNRISEMANGQMLCLGRQEAYFVEQALRRTTREVRAVAARGLEWWLTPEADAYWAVYAAVAERLSLSDIQEWRATPSELDRGVA